MRIDVVTIGGSSWGVTPPEIETPGVGGSELMLLQWSRVMASRGHEITIFNNPRKPGIYAGVSFKDEKEFDKTQYRDVFISFRGPKYDETVGGNFGIAVGWSTGQSERSYQEPWHALTDGIVGLSEFHLADNKKRYPENPHTMKIMEIGSLAREYPPTPKIPYQFIYNSVPIRGLIHLAEIWPIIRTRYPTARLLVTSDYRLWNGGTDPQNSEYQTIFNGMPGVELLGAIPRSELVRRECESEIHLYPCAFDELFCISNSEAQMAGCYAITSSVGALATTNFTGYKSPFLPGTNAFRDDVLREIDALYAQDAASRAVQHKAIREAAHKRFNWDRICDQWESYFAELFAHKK